MFQIAVCLAAVVALVSSQGFDFFGGFPSFAASPRDPRANRVGPVTFPQTSIGSETSGVRVGASGYGFVPPGTRGGKFYLLIYILILFVIKSYLKYFK
ncbi:hypothetical protein O3M35_008755 [Rhynocoris fuscipes]|uniref:Uncharacterized protein n=1 Tax=Rhynocoris fuscipes TaxID=488301 RepID=A0AAW1D851_9HEMI